MPVSSKLNVDPKNGLERGKYKKNEKENNHFTGVSHFSALKTASQRKNIQKNIGK